MKCMVAHARGRPAPGPSAIRRVEAEGTCPGAADGPRRWFRGVRSNAPGVARSVGFAWIMWRCGQIRVWGARLGDKCRLAFLAKGTVLPAACPERRTSVGVAAINVAVPWRIMAMTLSGRRLPICGSGLKFAVHAAEFLDDDPLERDVGAPDRTRGAVRSGCSSRWPARTQARFGARKPDLVAPADPALDRLAWQTRRIPRRPGACVASRGMTCFNAHLS